MNSKKIIISTFSLLLCALLVMGSINFAIDPLFQYHKPWFGLKANVINERYQNAGIAKNFDFENVIIGNSMSENFVVSDVEEVFSGKTVKLTASGSHVLDWTYLLEILNEREQAPENILINLDTGFFDASSETTEHEMPLFLYDNNYFNDVEYLFNFTLTKKYTYGALKANKNNTTPDYDTVFVWGGENDSGREIVLKNYALDEEKASEPQKENIFYTEENLELLKKYFEEMSDTQFVFFCCPFSVLYWKEKYESKQLESYKAEFEKTFRFMSQFDNVKVYFWVDEEMLDIIGNLDNYKDSTHYGYSVNKEILRRIDNNIGELPKAEVKWQTKLDVFFDFLNTYEYDSLL